MIKNTILARDLYQQTHWLQYPKGFTKAYSYGEPRVGGKSKFVCFFGIQYIIQEYLSKVPTMEDINEAEEECKLAFGTDKYFDRETWEKVNKLGYYPLRIKAVPEGTILNEGNVCFTIETTEDWFAKTGNGFEDIFLHSWYPTSVCTRTMNIKNNLKEAFKLSTDHETVHSFVVNDFGFRGGTLYEGAALGGAAFLVHFEGSDNSAASKLIKDYYGMQGRAKSVWATQHSVQTSYGKNDEIGYLKAQLERCPSDMICSVVIDAYDADNFILNVVGNSEIQQLIKNRAGRTVFRPDTNDPLTNMIKYSEILGNIFGYNLNSKQYKIINNNVGLLQGDGMNETTIPQIYNNYIKTGWSADNFVTGSGGGLLEENLTRDYSRWAVKLSSGTIDDREVDFQKNPSGDSSKKSKCGELILHRTFPTPNMYMTIESSKEPNYKSYKDELEVIYDNGKLYLDNFNNITQRASKL